MVNFHKVISYAVGPFILVLLLGFMLYYCFMGERSTPAAARVAVVAAPAAARVVVDVAPAAAREEESSVIREQKFPYAELYNATGHFSQRAKIGEGQFGDVYKAELQDRNRVVAVKKLKIPEQSKKEFIREVNAGVRLRHRNLVELVGYSNDRPGVLLIVFEYVPNGTLHKHLYESPNHPLSWENRYKIALGLAEAVYYLHEGTNQCCIHRDIKPKNVMLDTDFTPKLGDFGLARFTVHGQSLKTTNGGGTFGYIAPEVASGEKASMQSDVYSFGIVALEIATGKQRLENPQLVRWVWDFNQNNRLLEAVDRRLGTSFKKDEAKRVLVVGLLCCNPEFSKRPKMEQVRPLLTGVSPLSHEEMKPLEGYFGDATSATRGISHGSTSSSTGSTQYHTPAHRLNLA